jgi:hypothetical protein
MSKRRNPADGGLAELYERDRASGKLIWRGYVSEPPENGLSATDIQGWIYEKAPQTDEKPTQAPIANGASPGAARASTARGAEQEDDLQPSAGAQSE